MQRYILRRLLAAIPTLLGVTLISFSILHLIPGDPIHVLTNTFETAGGAEQVAELRAEFGLDRPLPVQFLSFLGKAMQGDLGRSIVKGREVNDLIAQALPHTMQLAFAALLLAVTAGVALGVIAAIFHRRWPDNAAILVSLVGVSMPEFWFGILAILTLAVRLPIFPSSGTGGVEFLLLPAMVLGARTAGAIARLTRSSMLDVLGQQYVLTAEAKGLRRFTVIWRHALRNAMIPVITMVGLQLGLLLGGTAVIEKIFNRQGVGQLMIDSIIAQDLPVLQGTILVVASAYLLLNLLVDVSYAWFDSRIRYA